MSKRAEEKALEAYPVKQRYNDYYGDYEDMNIVERVSFQEGYEQAEKDLGWHSVDESLPPVDEEVIALTDEFNTAPIYKIAFGHIVNPHLTVDIDGKPYKPISHDGWNIPAVKYWMPMPIIPEEEEK